MGSRTRLVMVQEEPRKTLVLGLRAYTLFGGRGIRFRIPVVVLKIGGIQLILGHKI